MRRFRKPNAKSLRAGILGASLLLTQHMQAQKQSGGATLITTRAPMILKEQVNHPWVEFSVGKQRYIALEEKIETFSTEGVDVHKVIDEKAAAKLTPDQKETLFSRQNVRDPVLKGLDDAGHVPPPPLPLRRSGMIALADVGLPMIIIEWPLMLLALGPVIVLEALLIRRWVSLSYGDAFKGITGANVLSTAVGVPLAWLIMLAAEFAVVFPVGSAADKWHWNLDAPVFQVAGLILGSAWIGPEGEDLKWIIPTAAAVLLVPCFFLSVWIESKVCIRTWKALDPEVVRRGVYRANLASYAALFILACGWVSYGLVTRKH
jgi:hypothetical protein